MKNTKPRLAFAAVCTAVLLAAGCGQNKEAFEQAGKDLEQGSYSYALEGYQKSIADGVMVPQSYRGAGLCHLRMAEYDDAVADFSSALSSDKLNKALKQDLLYYRTTANYKAGNYEAAMVDCQTLAEEFDPSGEISFLTASVALAMDSYDETTMQYDQAFANDSSYDMAIRIYQAYLEKDMEADGIRYLESSLNTDPKTAQDYCDLGRVYYYMEDYQHAREELTRAVNEDSTEALLLLGMVYMAEKDVSNARAMYQEYTEREENAAKGYNGLALCDMEERNYEGALANIAKGIPLATTEEMQGLLFNEIVVYERQLDFATAQQKAEEYNAMFPEDEEIARELAFLRSRTGKANG